MVQNQSDQTSAIKFTSTDFDMIANFAAARYGIDIKPEKREMIYARLVRRIRTLGLPDFRSYCTLAMGPHAGDEAEELLSALTTNVSSFFREPHHFALLRDEVLKDLQGKMPDRRPLRIWSAGCSTGQEPYTIAATILNTLGEAGLRDVRIVATDVDRNVLKRTKAATYRPSEVIALSNQQKDLLFAGGQAKDGLFHIRDDLRKMVSIERLNLVTKWSFAEPFDIIFCRNVVIYFERTTQHRLWERFVDVLNPNGCLFIGHSERLTGPAEKNFQNIGVTAFRKCTGQSVHAGRENS